MSSNTDFLLAIEDLTVSFDGFKAVDGLSLYVERDELRVIIGPNGAGKTTVLDMICGKTRPTSGSIKFANREMVGMREHEIVRAGVGRKFQTPSIYENLTVFENLEVSYPKGRTVLGSIGFRTTSEVTDRIHAVATEIGLTAQLDIEGAFLSHGQKQWLEIGMLLMQESQLVMLDEPVAGMSPPEREQTAQLIQRICKGRSIIVIEHDMEFVSRIAHKVTVLHLGKILAEGSMAEIQKNAKVMDVYLGH
ncbi:MAG: urea ABC transporter ATP-binding protein UrtD [Verrucomicrobiales bacterium]|nr:urea ABC transporter ATP-binding protein UrtD [Verrucomicrobiales bacterium]